MNLNKSIREQVGEENIEMVFDFASFHQEGRQIIVTATLTPEQAVWMADNLPADDYITMGFYALALEAYREFGELPEEDGILPECCNFDCEVEEDTQNPSADLIEAADLVGRFLLFPEEQDWDPDEIREAVQTLNETMIRRVLQEGFKAQS